MKKIALVSFAFAGSFVLQNVAFAQSGVTLYGLIDAGINFDSNAQTGKSASGLNGASKFSFQDGATGGIRNSRWGLKGVEDLGGGIRAVFALENGFGIGNGALAQGGAEFGRQAYVGLQTSAGTVTLGRQYDSTVDYVQPFLSAATFAGYMGTHAGDVDNEGNTARVNNAIKWTSTDYKGLKFGGLYSFGGQVGGMGKDQIWSLGAGYQSGPITLAAAYLNVRDPNISFYGNQPNASPLTSSNNLGSAGSATAAQSNPIFGGYASASTMQVATGGATIQLGNAILGAIYSNVAFRGLGSAAGPNPLGYRGNARFDNAELNAVYHITPSLLAGVAYTYTHASGANDRPGAVYQQGQTGFDYFLSKRTDVYAIAVYQHASGTDSLGQAAVANIGGQTPSSNNHQLAFRLGFTNRF